MNFFGVCTDCGEELEIYIPANYDGPTFCPECRSCDTIIERDEELSPERADK